MESQSHISRDFRHLTLRKLNKEIKRLSGSDIKIEPFSPNVQKPFREKEIGEVPLHYETQTEMGLGAILGDLRVFKASSVMWVQILNAPPGFFISVFLYHEIIKKCLRL